MEGRNVSPDQDLLVDGQRADWSRSVRKPIDPAPIIELTVRESADPPRYATLSLRLGQTMR